MRGKPGGDLTIHTRIQNPEHTCQQAYFHTFDLLGSTQVENWFNFIIGVPRIDHPFQNCSPNANGAPFQWSFWAPKDGLNGSKNNIPEPMVRDSRVAVAEP